MPENLSSQPTIYKARRAHRVTFCPEHGHSNSPPSPPTAPGRSLTLWVA